MSARLLRSCKKEGLVPDMLCKQPAAAVRPRVFVPVLSQPLRVIGSVLLLVLFVRCLGAAVSAAEGDAEPFAVESSDTAMASSSAAAAEDTDTVGILRKDVDILWTCVAAFLVFFMQAGFAMVETGFTRAKNCVNILMKNLMDFSVGSIVFWAVGFGLMFGTSTSGWFGTSDFFVSGVDDNGVFDNWTMAFWMFQVVFCATAATIVSGAMAERTKFVGYLCYSAIISAVIYPVFGSWAWGSLFHGNGWLEDFGFIDFAGSTVVHSVGGWAALAGAILLGPRSGKYGKDGSIRPIPGHSMPLAALGVFILWLGWFGFNPGSTTSVGGGDFARVAVTTNLAAATGAIVAMSISWVMSKKPEISMTLNGALAGLVAITCPCYTTTPLGALLIGAIAGILVYFSVVFFDHLGIDDPVGAISVHGVCGAWGTLSAGLFGAEKILGVGDANTGWFYGGGLSQVGVQLVGIAACFIWTFATCFVLFTILKKMGLLRVSAEEESVGLDLIEHGSSAYQLQQLVS